MARAKRSTTTKNNQKDNPSASTTTTAASGSEQNNSPTSKPSSGTPSNQLPPSSLPFSSSPFTNNSKSVPPSSLDFSPCSNKSPASPTANNPAATDSGAPLPISTPKVHSEQSHSQPHDFVSEQDSSLHSCKTASNSSSSENVSTSASSSKTPSATNTSFPALNEKAPVACSNNHLPLGSTVGANQSSLTTNSYDFQNSVGQGNPMSYRIPKKNQNSNNTQPEPVKHNLVSGPETVTEVPDARKRVLPDDCFQIDSTTVTHEGISRTTVNTQKSEIVTPIPHPLPKKVKPTVNAYDPYNKRFQQLASAPGQNCLVTTAPSKPTSVVLQNRGLFRLPPNDTTIQVYGNFELQGGDIEYITLRHFDSAPSSITVGTKSFELLPGPPSFYLCLKDVLNWIDGYTHRYKMESSYKNDLCRLVLASFQKDCNTFDSNNLEKYLASEMDRNMTNVSDNVPELESGHRMHHNTKNTPTTPHKHNNKNLLDNTFDTQPPSDMYYKQVYSPQEVEQMLLARHPNSTSQQVQLRMPPLPDWNIGIGPMQNTDACGPKLQQRCLDSNGHSSVEMNGAHLVAGDSSEPNLNLLSTSSPRKLPFLPEDMLKQGTSNNPFLVEGDSVLQPMLHAEHSNHNIFHKLDDNQKYDPFFRHFRQCFYPPANSPTEIDLYETTRLAVINRFRPHYRTFIDMLIQNFNGTRNINDLRDQFNAHLRLHQQSAKDQPPQNGLNPASASANQRPNSSEHRSFQVSTNVAHEDNSFLFNKTVAKTTSITHTGGKGLQVSSAKARNHDMIMQLDKNGKAPFFTPAEQYLKQHGEYCQRVLKIDSIYSLRDPDNPFEHYGEVSQTGYTRRIPVFVHAIPGKDAFRLNNHDNRQKWCNNFCKFWNAHETQGLFKYAETCRYSGDLTPQDETQAAPLSNWLTVRDTMDYILSVHSNQFKTISDVLRSPACLRVYFSDDLLPRIREHFASYVGNQQQRNGVSTASAAGPSLDQLNF
ncbi:hypothetical protein SEMRO_404_G135920.1 [Seminavis robusta]|uniref:Uncharacterized protein n=1 Tax=Seminavis robusta TaxID=568900 RepID=A0A9N8DVJ2_9STRA|nr:hypothetical protein SEMRO_404_G135920.1 [Seminavis robusta]|eukprot:Sro404_g135920.1 n/a (987) ;mRNA; f:36032-39075